MRATLFAFEYDFFENLDAMTAREKRITVVEFFMLSGLLIAGLIVFAFRRLQQQRHEFMRRLAAEGDARIARDEAMSDPLTGLLNRRALLHAVTSALEASESALPHALILLDLNGFKAVNDRYGHPVGDRLLETIARRMKSMADHDTVVARLGGDEFAVFRRSVRGPEDAQQLAQRLIAGLEAPIVIAGTTHSVGAGAGIALYPSDGSTHQELFRHADEALYRAKRSRKTLAFHRGPQATA